MATTGEQLPCDADGVCMVCKTKPQETETLNCRTCASLWHVPCLPEVPTTILDWECPDCSTPLLVNDTTVADAETAPVPVTAPSVAGDLISAIRAIENDASLTDVEKAKKRQELVGGSSKASDEVKNRRSGVLDIFDGSINCSFCMQLPERPVTTSCGHNFCLKCFEKWIQQGKRTCANCRAAIPAKMASNPRINAQSHKEKRSSYAPEAGVRYDGVYRIEKCWRKVGVQGHKVCRYLFVRCDNEPAPWTSDLSGDRPRPLPTVKEFKGAVDITERKGDPSWDFDEEKGCWLWKKPPPLSKKPMNVVDPIDPTKIQIVRPKAKKVSFKIKDRLLKEFGCNICRKVLASPLTTPCAHNFCKGCLEGAFSGQSYIRNRATKSGRSLRTQKNIMKCPTCSTDIADYLQNPQVNREMMGVIETLQRQAEQMDEESSEESSAKSDENLKPDEETDVSKPSDSNEKVEEEINKNDLNPLPQKRRKGADGKTVVNTEEPVDEAEVENKAVTCN
ncbi:hypothetical protein TSUD_255030 [Trifolium subterraneum]|uniref:RING-type domain-containing protein n=1 Tax=Trifolium subterraneum TaxID=3900 RepID=A0A2Z6MHM6_TRISU|nr:hypothetical protein TSUD_255030 [Trifolium subterraneum]